MGLAYDFDIIRRDVDDGDTERAAPVDGAGGTVRALFRNTQTADALRAASPKIRQIFVDAGFDLDVHQSGLVPGVYPLDDAEDRARILRTLFALIKERGVQGEYSGAFDLGDFLSHVRQAQPHAGIVRVAPEPQQAPQPRPQQNPAAVRRRSVPGRIGFALGLAVLLFAVLKYLEAAGAAVP